MPVDQAWRADAILDANSERLTAAGDDARRTVRLPNAEHRCRFAVHLDRASL